MWTLDNDPAEENGQRRGTVTGSADNFNLPLTARTDRSVLPVLFSQVL